MGLSRSDWMALTPGQYKIFRLSWHERHSTQGRQAWEIARWQVFRSLCPPNKKRISITDLIEFPWDTPDPGNKVSENREANHSQQRFEELKQRWK